MKNDFIYKFKNTVSLKIKGKNIERFMKRIVSLNIELLNVKYLKYNEIIIQVEKKYLEKIEEIKTIYEIDVVDTYGLDKFKQIIKKFKYIIISILISFIFILYLSNTIFDIEVVHNDKNIRELILTELRESNIRVYGLKKSYKSIAKIKQKILEKHKDQIEWLEIENSGTKYIVRVEERKLNISEENNNPRNIVAKKDALILNVQASSGEIQKNKNDYVKKGDIIVSGSITLYDQVKQNVAAEGKVYGEVWYKVTIEYPLNYEEEKVTSNKAIAYTFNIGNKKLTTKKDGVVTKKEVIFKHLFLPISFIKETKNKVEIVKQKLTKEEAIEKAIKLAKSKLESKLSDNEYIITSKNLKVEENNSKIVLDIFFTVCEDITDYSEISLIEGE